MCTTDNENVGLSPVILLLGGKRNLDHFGGRDWGSDNGLFEGRRRTLYPAGLLEPKLAEWDWSEVTDFFNMNNTIEPGAQGTNGDATWDR